MKQVIWTAAYHPFIMGGDVHAPIATEIEVGEKIPLGKGFFGYVVVNPKTGKTHIAESVTGAFVGTSLEQVKQDIAEGDKKVMAKQIKDAAERLTRAMHLAPDEFWGEFRGADDE